MAIANEQYFAIMQAKEKGNLYLAVLSTSHQALLFQTEGAATKFIADGKVKPPEGYSLYVRPIGLAYEENQTTQN